MQIICFGGRYVGFILGAALNLEGYLGIVFAIAVMGYFILDAIEKNNE